MGPNLLANDLEAFVPCLSRVQGPIRSGVSKRATAPRQLNEENMRAEQIHTQRKIRTHRRIGTTAYRSKCLQNTIGHAFSIGTQIVSGCLPGRRIPSASHGAVVVREGLPKGREATGAIGVRGSRQGADRSGCCCHSHAATNLAPNAKRQKPKIHVVEHWMAGHREREKVASERMRGGWGNIGKLVGK